MVHSAGIRVFGAMLTLTVAACGADESGRGDLDLGFSVTDEATARDVGLPTYPGSKPYKDDDDDSGAARIGISTPLFGLKVAAVELETTDQPQKVATFYKKALSKYGKVLECSEGDVEIESLSTSAGEGDLKCDAGNPEEHSVVYKVGTEANQRIVAIKPHGSGTQFSLVHVDTRDESER
jgi:hypothetical protein